MPENKNDKPRLKTIRLKVDEADYLSITEAIAIRKSGLFYSNGKLLLPEGDSELTGQLLAEVCRGWVERLNADLVRQATKEA